MVRFQVSLSQLRMSPVRKVLQETLSYSSQMSLSARCSWRSLGPCLREAAQLGEASPQSRSKWEQHPPLEANGAKWGEQRAMGACGPQPEPGL